MLDTQDRQDSRAARRRPSYRGTRADWQGRPFDPAALRALLEATVASGFDIEEDLLRLPTRGEARIALARQAAMYLAHVACGLTKTEVGQLFERDRTTAHHACLVIEQRRDDDAFDRALDHLEQVVKIVAGPLEVTWPVQS